jgi:hypothetical protein
MSGYKTSENILAFIKSINNIYTQNEVDLIVLYKDISQNVINDIKKAYPEIILQDYSSYYEKYKIQMDLSVFHSKYIIIYYFIKNALQAKYRYILLSDINDVFIQDDIFTHEDLNEINFFAEKLNIGQCKINLKKYKSCYSHDVIKKDWNKKIINNGIILVKHERILAYLEFYLKELLDKIPICKTSNADQAILTHCVHHNFTSWDDVTIHNFPNNLCLHLAQPLEDKEFNKSINLTSNKITHKGFTPCIIHQYNRSETLILFIYSQFKLKYNKPTIRSLLLNKLQRKLNRVKTILNQTFTKS